MTYLIIGNGVASVGAIEGIRRKDKRGKIIVVSQEPEITYGRPLISYYLAGKIGAEGLPLRAEDYYADRKVELRLGETVTSLDVAAKKAVTDKGEIAYDKLLIATGGKPFVPPIPGKDGPGVYSFTTKAHADQLIELASKVKKVVVIGGGLIGLKAAESLFDRGVDVSIVELASRVLSAAFDDAAGGIVAERLAQVGLKVFCNVSAKEIVRDKKGTIKSVLLTDGRSLPAEAVVIAIGVTPAMDLAKAAGIACERGILADKRLRTSDASVFAAGDVAQAPDLISGEQRVVPIWPNAYDQGFYAGRNMAGQKALYQGGLPMNSISFYGLPTQSVGLVNPPADDKKIKVETVLDAEKRTYRKLVFKNKKLVGYVLVGDIENSGLYTSFVKFGFPVSDEVKARLLAGQPGVLLWPEEFLKETWNPGKRSAA